MFRQISTALCFTEIGGRIFWIKVTPALKRAPRLRRRTLQLRIKKNSASLAMMISDVVDRDNALPDTDHALDHPVQRTASQHLIHAFGPHARAAHRPFRQTGALSDFHLLNLPGGKIIDMIDADAEFDDMDSHAC